jgi:riboflavin biosynthesis pyrimidine reductase
MTELPENVTDKVEIIKGDVKKLVKKLTQRGFNNLYVDGGKVIQSFLKEDLIDELIITRVPIILGEGIPLFRKLEQKLKFKHKKTSIYNNTLVKSHYTRERS